MILCTGNKDLKTSLIADSRHFAHWTSVRRHAPWIAHAFFAATSIRIKKCLARSTYWHHFCTPEQLQCPPVRSPSVHVRDHTFAANLECSWPSWYHSQIIGEAQWQLSRQACTPVTLNCISVTNTCYFASFQHTGNFTWVKLHSTHYRFVQS